MPSNLFINVDVQMDPLVPFVKAVIIMDGEGKRLSSKVRVHFLRSFVPGLFNTRSKLYTSLWACAFIYFQRFARFFVCSLQYYAKEEFPTEADRVRVDIRDKREPHTCHGKRAAAVLLL